MIGQVAFFLGGWFLSMAIINNSRDQMRGALLLLALGVLIWVSLKLG